MTSTFVVHLIGYPGVGKYTIARALIDLAEQRKFDRFVLVDNHLTNNVVFSVLDVDGVRELPARVWDHVGDIRDVLYRSIEELSPPDWSFVFTNVLVQDEPRDQPVVDRLRLLASERGSRYVPIQVNCAEHEHLLRVPNADRAARHKWIDPNAVQAFLGRKRLLRASRDQLDIDVTDLTPVEAADMILRQLDVRHHQ